MLRILIAAVLGAAAMFVWTALAHTVLPLGRTGLSQLKDEPAVFAVLDAATERKPGLYFYPWVDPSSPNMEAKAEAKSKTGPSGLLLYLPAGEPLHMGSAMAIEYAKQLAQALIAAFLLSMAVAGAYLMRVGFVLLIHVSAAIATNVSLWNWFQYPGAYIHAQIIIEGVSGLLAGLVIAAIVRGR